MANAKFDYALGVMGNSNDRVDVTNPNSYVYKGALYKGTNHMGRKIAFEPQRLYNFELQIVGLDQLYTADKPGTGNYGNSENEISGTFDGNTRPRNAEYIHFASAAERILVACSSFSVPDTTFGMIEIPHYNNTTKYAGKVEFGDASLVVEQYLGSFTEQIMTTWARCVYDPRTQNIGYKNDYAKDMFVIEYDSKGGTPRVWKMENAWPNVLPGADWDYNSTDRRQMTYTIKCDRCVPDYAIDTRTLSYVQDNAINSITYSSSKYTSQGYTADANWSWDSESKSYYNETTGNIENGITSSNSNNGEIGVRD